MQRYQVQQDCRQQQLQLQRRRVQPSQDSRIRRHLKKQDCSRDYDQSQTRNRHHRICDAKYHSCRTNFSSHLVTLRRDPSISCLHRRSGIIRFWRCHFVLTVGSFTPRFHELIIETAHKMTDTEGNSWRQLAPLMRERRWSLFIYLDEYFQAHRIIQYKDNDMLYFCLVIF